MPGALAFGGMRAQGRVTTSGCVNSGIAPVIIVIFALKANAMIEKSGP